MAFSASGLQRDILSGAVFSGMIAVGDHVGIRDFYNDRQGVSGGVVFRNDIAPREIINAVEPVDFRALQQIQLSKLQILFQAAPIDVQLSGLRQNFQSVFSGSATLLSGNLTSIAMRQGSRGEVLFGTGTNISTQQVQEALN